MLRFCGFVAVLLTGVSFAIAQESRTWSDASGKFKIKGKFISEENGTVTLETEAGQELEIELKKLSSADQKAVADLKKEMSDNPFKAKGDDPFKPKGKGSSKTHSKKASEDDEPTAQMREVTVDWGEADVIPLGGETEEWKLDVPVGGEPIYKSKGKTISLPPKTNFHEGLRGLAINPVAKKAAVGYIFKDTRLSRVVICDLETGKAGPAASGLGLMVPLALHDDGKHIVMRREEFGFGNLDRMEVWVMRGSKANTLVKWTPYEDLNGGDKDVMWAEFVDEETLATSSRSGRVALWKFPEITPICYFDTVNGAVPGLSPDRKLIAYSNGDHVGIFDVAKREVILKRPTPTKLTWPYLAFSPTGKRIGCVAQDKILCWNTEDGALINEIPANGAHFHGDIDFPHDNFLLANEHVLVDIDNQIKLWNYDGAEQIKTAGYWTFIAVSDGTKAGTLQAVQLPHAAALDLQQKAVTDPSLFVFKSGTKVKLDVSGIPDPAAREKALQSLTKKLKDMDCTIGPDGTIDLVASIEGPKEHELRFHSAGTYKMQGWNSWLKFVYQGKVAWQMMHTNVPAFMVHLKAGENIETHLRSREKPTYELYNSVNLPKFLQKPAGNGPQAVHTIGQSRISTGGIR